VFITTYPGVVDGDFEPERRSEQGDCQLAGAVVIGIRPPVEPARRDRMDKQVLIEKGVAGVDEGAADGPFAAVPSGAMRGSSIVG
jgi:hypothetical protein